MVQNIQNWWKSVAFQRTLFNVDRTKKLLNDLIHIIPEKPWIWVVWPKNTHSDERWPKIGKIGKKFEIFLQIFLSLPEPLNIVKNQILSPLAEKVDFWRFFPGAVPNYSILPYHLSPTYHLRRHPANFPDVEFDYSRDSSGQVTNRKTDFLSRWQYD